MNKIKRMNLQLYYSTVNEKMLSEKALEVSVWSCGSIVGENSVIGSVHISLKRLNDVQFDRKGIKTIDGWFKLNGYSSRF